MMVCVVYVRMWVGVWLCLCVCQHDKTKTPDRNNLKLGTVVFLDTMSKPFDLGSEVQGSGLGFVLHRKSQWFPIEEAL